MYRKTIGWALHYDLDSVPRLCGSTTAGGPVVSNAYGMMTVCVRVRAHTHASRFLKRLIGWPWDRFTGRAGARVFARQQIRQHTSSDNNKRVLCACTTPTCGIPTAGCVVSVDVFQPCAVTVTAFQNSAETLEMFARVFSEGSSLTDAMMKIIFIL